MELLNSYKHYIKNETKDKIIKRNLYKRKTILTPTDEKREYFNENITSLYNIDKYKKRNQKRQTQNEISSIGRKIKEENKNMIFITSTLKPIKNLTERKLVRTKNKNLIKDDNERINHILKEQYETFTTFNKKVVNHNYINKENKKTDLRLDFLRVLELTKKYNIHQHEIKLTNTLEETIELIKRIIYKREKTDIGRIEIRIDEKLLKEILKKGITLRIKNKYIKTTFKEINFKQKDTRTYYKIKETEQTRGNYIYLKPIHDIENNEEHITKYLFKYLLKRSNDETQENKLFHHLGMKQKNYSQNFFTDKITKRDLFNISSKLYRIIKHNNHNIELLNKYDIDKKTTIYETRKLFNKGLIHYDDKEKEIFNIDGNGNKKILFGLYKFNKETKKGKWGELEVLERQRQNKFTTTEQDYKLKKLTFKKEYEKCYFDMKIYEKERELKISKKLTTQYKNYKKQFPLLSFNEMSKVQKSFSKFEKLENYKKELKKDWELNYMFRIHFDFKQEIEFQKYITLKNYKREEQQRHYKERLQQLEDKIKERDEKEEYISKLIENKNYKIEEYEGF